MFTSLTDRRKMNTCHRYEDLFSEYLEGDISRDNKNALEDHVRECSVCSQKLGNVSHIRQMLVGLPRVKVSSDFDSLLHARIRLENRRRKTLSGRLLGAEQFRLPAYVMSFAIILIAFVLVLSKISQTQHGLPGEASNLAAIDNSKAQPASGLVTIYPIDRTSVNKVMHRQFFDGGLRIATRTVQRDTVRMPAHPYSITQTQARVYQTTY